MTEGTPLPKFTPNLRTPVRSLFSRVQARVNLQHIEPRGLCFSHFPMLVAKVTWPDDGVAAIPISNAVTLDKRQMFVSTVFRSDPFSQTT